MGDSRARTVPAPQLVSFSDELRSAFLLRNFSYAAACGALSKESPGFPRGDVASFQGGDDLFVAPKSSGAGSGSPPSHFTYGKEPIPAAWRSPRFARGSLGALGPAASAPEPGCGVVGAGGGGINAAGGGSGLPGGDRAAAAAALPHGGGHLAPRLGSCDSETSGHASSLPASPSQAGSEPSFSDSIEFEWPDPAHAASRACAWGQLGGGGGSPATAAVAAATDTGADAETSARFAEACGSAPQTGTGGFHFEDARREHSDEGSLASSNSVSPRSSPSPPRPPGSARSAMRSFPLSAAALLASALPRRAGGAAEASPPATARPPSAGLGASSATPSPTRRPGTPWSLRSSPARSPVPPPRPPRPAFIVSPVTRRKLPPSAYAYLSSMPLAALAAENQLALLARVLRSCPPLDLADKNGRTALHHAASLGRQVACEMLAWAGADLEARDVEGKTPEQTARGGGHKELADALAGLHEAQKEWHIRITHATR